MPHEATLIYSTALLRQAVFAFWRRSVGVGFFVALLIATIGLVVLVALGQASWIIGALATVLAVGIGFAAAVYIVHYRNSLRKFRQMDTPRSTFRADESSFTMSSDIGTTTLLYALIATSLLELCRSIMTDKQAAEFEATNECNFAISPSGIGRFRVNAFVQQGAKLMSNLSSNP